MGRDASARRGDDDTRTDDTRAIVRPTGEIDIATSPTMGAALRRAMDDGARTVVVDLSDVTFLDSSGIATLIDVRRAARTSGGDLWVRAPRPNVRRVLEVLSLVSLIEHHDDPT